MAMRVLTDEQWNALEPLLNEVRPWATRPIRAFRRTIEAIVWRHENGAKWRSIPAELGPWWMAAQTFIRWAKLEVWERLHRLAQEWSSAWSSSTAPSSGRIRRPPVQGRRG
jgi:transposase